LCRLRRRGRYCSTQTAPGGLDLFGWLKDAFANEAGAGSIPTRTLDIH